MVFYVNLTGLNYEDGREGKAICNFAPVIQPNANLGLLQGDFANVIEVPNWLMLSQGHHPQWAGTNLVSP